MYNIESDFNSKLFNKIDEIEENNKNTREFIIGFIVSFLFIFAFVRFFYSLAVFISQFDLSVFKYSVHDAFIILIYSFPSGSFILSMIMSVIFFLSYREYVKSK